MRNKLFLLMCLFLCMSPVTAQTLQEKYIERYANIAVAEMYRSGVPASITLAQGLLESGYGRSELALKSNNHFGIKCHNGWQGGRVYHDDDRKGECFRRYENPEDSYRDHSDFLRYRDRYKFLFEYKITDYKSWAYGLKKAGYATDPDYPKKLINLIEEYSLHYYDTKPASFVKEVSSRTEHKSKGKVRKPAESKAIPTPPSQIEQIQTVGPDRREVFIFSLSREMYSRNGVLFIYASEGETYGSIAEANRLFLRELLKFNDLTDEEPLKPGTVVYLQKKKKQAETGLEMHVMEEGQTLRSVAQRYGIRLDKLCKINGIEKDNIVRPGDIVRLRK